MLLSCAHTNHRNHPPLVLVTRSHLLYLYILFVVPFERPAPYTCTRRWPENAIYVRLDYYTRIVNLNSLSNVLSVGPDGFKAIISSKSHI